MKNVMEKLFLGGVILFAAFSIFALAARDFGCQKWHYELRTIKGVQMDHKVCDVH